MRPHAKRSRSFPDWRGGVGPHRNTYEPAEQRGLVLGGGWGGKGAAKENVAQSNMSPTQSGERAPQGLRGVREAAKARRQERFTALLHHLSVDLLLDSYYALKRLSAPGVDGVAWKEYEDGLEDRISDLHSRVYISKAVAQILTLADSLIWVADQCASF